MTSQYATSRKWVIHVNGSPTRITHDNNEASTKSEFLNGQFVSVFATEDKSSFPVLGTSFYPDAPDIKVHPNGVRKLLKNPKPNRAIRPGGISSRFIKEMTESLTSVLTLVFSVSLKQHMERGECFCNFQKGR